jgi:transketolase
MRKQFSEAIGKIAVADSSVVFLTGDLGFMALEKVRDAIGERFVNVGVCEQNMISVAAGLALQGLKPVCYSIAPFTVFRPAEQIRIDVCLHNLNVKIIGNGGGYGYGIMGATHHALEDIAVLSSFQNMRCFLPFCNEDVCGIMQWMFGFEGPSYLRLGFGVKPSSISLPDFAPVRQLSKGNNITVVALGPAVLNVMEAVHTNDTLKNAVEVFVVSEMPLTHATFDLLLSVRKTGKLLVVEEHVQRGGLGENLSWLLLQNGSTCVFDHVFASGYREGRCGSQHYHQKVSGIDPVSIGTRIKELIRGK